MKRQPVSVLPILLVSITLPAFSTSLNVYAQGRSGELPGAKPTPTPAPKVGVKRASTSTVAPTPVAPAVKTVILNQAIRGRLAPNEKAPSGYLFEEYTLNARSGDHLSFQLQSEGSAAALQIFDKEGIEVAVARDSSTGTYTIKTPSGGLPADGEYKVRISTALSGKNAVPYTLTVNRLGLLPSVYYGRLDGIYRNHRENDPASVSETIAKLEELTKEDAGKPGAFEFLGIIYLNNARNVTKAANAMEQAIKANGAAVVKISFDSQWRRMNKLRTGNFGWEEPRTGWLRIRPGQISLTDASSRSLATLTGAQIKELAKIMSDTNNLVVITAEGQRRPFVFMPSGREAAEADLVVKLIQTHVMGKAN
jgi:hypothetical protein